MNHVCFMDCSFLECWTISLNFNEHGDGMEAGLVGQRRASLARGVGVDGVSGANGMHLDIGCIHTWDAI